MGDNQTKIVNAIVDIMGCDCYTCTYEANEILNTVSPLLFEDAIDQGHNCAV